MIAVRRLLGVAAFLAVASLLTSSGVWGDPGDKQKKNWREDDKNKTASKVKAPLAADEEEERNRFLDAPVVVYQDREDRFFALQVKPALNQQQADARPIDYLLLVDTSASKAGGPLAIANEIAVAMSRALGKDDRMAVWTANLRPRDLSHGYKSGGGKDLEPALAELSKELPLGAVDLKKSISESVKSFEVKASRRRVLVFVGDGRSIGHPLDTDSRAALCAELTKNQIAFFAVPLGDNIDPQNLHSLVAGTGGRAVRIGNRNKPKEDNKKEAVVLPPADDLAARLKVAAAVPILYNVEITLPKGAKDVLPSQLPPLRGDSATLVAGKLDRDVKAIDFTVKGEVAGKEFSASLTHQVPQSEVENHFLAGVHGQWRNRKEIPALLPAERALAFAYKQVQLAVEDLVSRADMALEADKNEIARRIYEQALELDPHSAQARGGLVLIEKMKTNKMDRAAMLKELRLDATSREVMRIENGKRRIVVLAEEDEKADPNKAGKDLPRDPLDEVKKLKRIAEQQVGVAVNEAIQQASRVVRAAPADAYRILEQTLADVRGNPDVSDETKRNLEARLATTMRTMRRVGDAIERDQAQALALRAAADARLDLRRTENAANDRLRERLRVFRNLMDQAREQRAYELVEGDGGIREDLIRNGQTIPPAVTAAGQIALSGYHLRELRELKRQRQARWLATMLEVERSAVPFPDEPPVEYPSPAVIRRITRGAKDNWADFSKERIDKYAVATFGADSPGLLREVRQKLNQRIPEYPEIDDPKLTLPEFLDRLSTRYGISFDINEKAFKQEGYNEVLTRAILEPNTRIPAMKNVTLGTLLKRILAKVPVPSTATYIIRKEQVEITTSQFAVAEKTVRVYPVADLVTPIPNSYNSRQVQQTGSILGQLGQFGAGGQLGAGGLNFGIGGALGALGGQLGALGALGGQLGALGALGGQLGALGALGALGGQLGALGGQLGALGGQLGGQLGGALGGQLGQLGQLGAAGQQGFQGQGNLGVGGGALGFTGGQLGQLGNLGGQFGLQGGNQSQLLITLIKQVVGRPGDWAVNFNPITGEPINPTDMESRTDTLNQDNNNLGYYPPALALVVKAPSLVHTREFHLPFAPAAVPPAPAGGELAFLDPDLARRIAVAPESDEKDDEVSRKKAKDPKRIWQAALAKGVKDPGLIIATTDYLAQNRKFDHVAEFLKANLRQGIVVKPWVYKSLAIALRETGGSAEEIERAEVSAADLEPLDAVGYLVAARSLADDRSYERAIAFCKQAAQLSPGLAQPYADAARYAEMAGDATSLAWAAGKLLSQDWPSRNNELQQSAMQKVESLSRRLENKADADRLRAAIDVSKRRDLVVRLVWQGDADMDLKVQEPTGSVACSLNRQTINGGTLIASGPGTPNAETYVAARGFSGAYRIHVEKVWGRPMGNKVQVKIIRYQGTPDETEQLVTLRMNSNVSEPITVNLENGRRRETAYVPPAGAQEALEQRPAVDMSQTTTDAVLTRLRQTADPDTSNLTVVPPQGGVRGSGGYATTRPMTMPKANQGDQTLSQSKVSSFVQNSLEVTAKTVLSADRRSVRVSLTPVYNTAAAKTGPVKVVNPVFPGATTSGD